MIIVLLAEGWTEKEIAHELDIARPTVSCHSANIRVKLRARNITHAVALWIRGGGSTHTF